MKLALLAAFPRVLAQLVRAVVCLIAAIILLAFAGLMRRTLWIPRFFDRHPGWLASRLLAWALDRADDWLSSVKARLQMRDILRRIRSGKWPWHAQ